MYSNSYIKKFLNERNLSLIVESSIIPMLPFPFIFQPFSREKESIQLFEKCLDMRFETAFVPLGMKISFQLTREYTHFTVCNSFLSSFLQKTSDFKNPPSSYLPVPKWVLGLEMHDGQINSYLHFTVFGNEANGYVNNTVENLWAVIPLKAHNQITLNCKQKHDCITGEISDSHIIPKTKNEENDTTESCKRMHSLCRGCVL